MMEKGERLGLAMLPLTNTNKGEVNGLCQQNVCRSISVIVHTQSTLSVTLGDDRTLAHLRQLCPLWLLCCAVKEAVSHALTRALSLCDFCVYMVIVL